MPTKMYHGIWSYNKEDIIQGNGIPGYLEQLKSSSILTTIGIIDSESPIIKGGTITNKVVTKYEKPIYGLVDSNTKITLYKVRAMGGKFSFNGLNKEQYSAYYVFFDGRIDDFDSIGKGSIIISIPDLAKRFEKSINIQTQKEQGPHIQITKYESNIFLGKINNIEISFRDYLYSKIGGENYSNTIDEGVYNRKYEIEVKEKTELILKLDTNYNLDEVLEFIEKILRFFSFFMNQKIVYEELTIICNDALKFDKPILLKGDKYIKKDRNDYLLLYNAISSDIEKIMNTWIENYYTITHVIDTYFLISYTKGLLMESVFLYYIQSLEGIYYNLFNPPYNETEYEELINSFTKAKKNLSKDYPILKKTRLNANDISLFNKLSNIGKYIDYDWNDDKGHTTKNDIVEFRNILSHGLGGEKRKKIDDNITYLYELIERMEFVVEMCILKMLNIPTHLFTSISANKKLSLKRKFHLM